MFPLQREISLTRNEMNIFNALPSMKLMAATLSLLPLASFGQLNAGTTDSESGNKTVEPSETPTTEKSAKVLKVKKMTRYSLRFVVDMPSIYDVLTYMSENLGVAIENAKQLEETGINTNALATRNFEVFQNENGDFEVKVRFYPPVDPMSAEVEGIQKKSRLRCANALDQLKADAVN